MWQKNDFLLFLFLCFFGEILTDLNVSVIIPAFNAEKTISFCLTALQKQVFSKTFEIIVVDDGSTDDTKKVVQMFKNVKLISQKNSGPAVARNVGVKKASGKYVVFIDSDCVPEQDWLEQMIEPFEDEKVSGVQGAYKTKQKSLVARFSQIEIEYRYKRLKKSKKIDWIGSYSAAYRRKLFLDEIGFLDSFPTASGEDSELSYRLAEKNHKLVFKENAYVFHSHPTSIAEYVKKKFTHAKWRLLLYSLHPEKGVKDSYTPQGLKFEILAVFSTIISLLGFFIVPQLLFLFISSVLILFFLMIPFVFFAIQRDFLIGILAPLFLLFRDLAFLFGLISGVLEKVWKR